MDREAWGAAVHRVAKSRVRLSDGTELRHVLSARCQFSPELCWNVELVMVDLSSSVKCSVSAEACVVFHTWRGCTWYAN